MSHVSDCVHDAASIARWLVRWVSQVAGVPEKSVSIHMPWADYGLSSIEMVNLSADLETHLSVELNPTLSWEYPTIEKLALHLASVSGT